MVMFHPGKLIIMLFILYFLLYQPAVIGGGAGLVSFSHMSYYESIFNVNSGDFFLFFFFFFFLQPLLTAFIVIILGIFSIFFIFFYFFLKKVELSGRQELRDYSLLRRQTLVKQSTFQPYLRTFRTG